MQLNREKIQRMFTGSQANGGGGGGGDTEGLASQLWVEQNYLSKEFFLRLFNIHGEDENDDPVDVQPNDLETTITDIEAMFGFWTEQYLSALGQNSEQGGGGITLNAALASINNSPLGNPTGTSTVLMFNGTTWVYASMGSTDMNTVWTALAAATNQQINISHLTTALSGYATTSQLSDYATVTDLEQLASYFNTLSGYFTNGAANEAVKLETARTIWGQQFDGTANITGDISQATCLEFSGIAGTATNGGFIDFHYAGGGADYTSRIIEDVSGVLKINNTIWAQLSGNVSIGTSTISQTYKLDVAGYTKTTRLYLADGVYLEYDSTNSGVHLVGAGFYSDSYVSALGVNSGGGGGGSDYIPLTGSDQIAGSLIPVTTNAYDLGDSTHAWRNIRGNSIYASNSITTYYLTANSTVTAVGSITSTAGNIIASTGYVSSAAGFKVSSLNSLEANDYIILAGGNTTKLKTVNGYSLFGDGNIDAGGSVVGNYLPLSGGTISSSSIYPLIINSTSSSGSIMFFGLNSTNKASVGYLNGLAFIANEKSPYPRIGVTDDGIPQFWSSNQSSSAHTIWHDGNDGSGSGLDADLLDGHDSAYFLPLTGGTITNSALSPLIINSTSSSGSIMFFSLNSTNKASVGYLNGLAFIANEKSPYPRIGVTDDGIPQFWSSNQSSSAHTIWHDGNDGSGSGLDADLLDGHDSAYFATASALGDYLPLTGGTITNSAIGPLIINSTSSYGSALFFSLNSTGKASVGYVNGFACLANEKSPYPRIGVTDDGIPQFWSSNQSSSAHTIWHDGNDGSGSGLDADLLDGHDSAYFATATALGDYLPLTGGTLSSTNMYVLNLNNNQAECSMNFKINNSNKACIGYFSNGTFIYNYAANKNIHLNNSGYLIISDKVSVGAGESPSYKLDVNGTLGVTDATTLSSTLSVANTITLTGGTAAKQRIYFDSTHYIELDSSGYFHFSHGVYSDGFMSALGLNSGGGSGGDYIPLSGSTSITGDLTPSNNNSVSLGSSSKLWAGVYCINLRAYGASSINGNLTMAGNITPTVNQQYGLGTSSLKFSSLHVLNSYTYGTLAVNNFTLFEDTYSPAQGVTYSQSHLKSTLNVMYLDCSNGIQSSNTITSRSDIRLKTIQRYIDYLSVDAVASAPIFDYTWNEKPNGNVFVGTSAQYWQQVLPNAVSPMFDRFLSLDYSATALVSAVITARKVVDHEARIRLLEVENAALRNEINQLKKVA